MDTSKAMLISKQVRFEKEIQFFKDYLETLENFLRTEAEYLDSYIVAIDSGDEPVPEGSSPREVEEQLRDRLDGIDDFANLLRSSFFISLYSFLEWRLIEECQYRQGAHIALSLSDIRDHKNPLDRFQRHFANVEIYFPGDTTEWREIQDYRVLRNCIVHNRGRLSGFRRKKQRFLDYIKRKRDQLLISGDEIVLNAAFCSEAFETVKRFFCLLISSGHS
jgi:hypothetical protein